MGDDMTLAELIEAVKRIVDDTSVPDDWVIGWLNECLGDLTPVLRLEERSVASVIAGMKEIALPVDLYEVRFVRLLSESNPRKPLHPADSVSTGYKRWGKVIILQPPPTVDDTVELWYWRTPTPLKELTDVPEVPEAFQHLLVWYAGALYQSYQRDIDLERVLFYRRYTEGKQALDKYTLARTLRNPLVQL